MITRETIKELSDEQLFYYLEDLGAGKITNAYEVDYIVNEMKRRYYELKEHCDGCDGS